MKPTGGGKKNSLPVGLMKTNPITEQTNLASAKVEVIKLGQDVHAAQVVVVVQRDGCPPQPAQKIATDRYLSWVKQLQLKYPGAQLYACYEAGPCGYWLHRELTKLGVKSYVVAPVALNGRRKNDQRDARALTEQLDRYVRDHRHAFSPVAVPAPEQEQQRALLRHRQALLKSLGRCVRQGRSLLLLQGLRVRGKWWGARQWEQLKSGLPAWLVTLLGDFQAQAQLLHAQLLAMDKRVAALGREKNVTTPRGIGTLTWLTLLLEMVNWERFNNRRQVASYSGLCPGEYSSGESRRELSIDKHGNRRVRTILIQAAWRLSMFQPGYPPLAKLRAAQGSRARKRAIVAVARKLVIDLWRIATGRTTADQVGLAGAAASTLAA
jgi:transposase